MSKDQLIHHGNKRQFQGIIRDVLLRTAFLIFQMISTSPGHILTTGFIMHPSLIFAAAFSTADPAGKAVPVLVFPGVIAISFFTPPLFQNRIGQFKLFLADDCFMVVLHQVLVKLSPVLMAVKAAVRIGLLEQDVTRILFIPDDGIDGTRCPMSALLSSNATLIQFIRNLVGTFPRKRVRKDLFHDFRLLRHNHHLPVHVVITIWGIGNDEGSILKAPLDTPLLIFRNGHRLAFRQTA